MVKTLSICLLLWHILVKVKAYKNRLYTIANFDESRTRGYKCAVYEGITFKEENGQWVYKEDLSVLEEKELRGTSDPTDNETFENPFDIFEQNLHKFLFGENIELEENPDDPNILKYEEGNKTDIFKHYVIGNYFHAETFNNKSAVHLPPTEFVQRGHCYLNITRDYMQTAVNAFAIFLYGSIADIQQMPADYILRSSRTIAMMKIAREKIAVTWTIVKGNRSTNEITSDVLELYRPLFKYINGREIARLNLSDERILTYIGTHSDLDRHQVGVVASKYIEINPNWSQPKYLNLMNNLLCGVPMTFMRKIPENSYLQLSRQVFYHIKSCDPLQRRFYLSMMTRTQALGKSYSWDARDVSRLGILLAEVNGEDLSSIKPEAMSGIASKDMKENSAFIISYIEPKRATEADEKKTTRFLEGTLVTENIP
ncbi:hypothetical protein KGM_213954 [Danaus plexippus plexippus]|uniref:Uncharacterized protein n=1 Tax=Danaus plexippus plexippus TaxID=278856 RepID=A0A212F7K5_DANPL|nr:hypothetical protein KGM_213954 [Danaus plexippus plexippus]